MQMKANWPTEACEQRRKRKIFTNGHMSVKAMYGNTKFTNKMLLVTSCYFLVTTYKNIGRPQMTQKLSRCAQNAKIEISRQ